VSERVAGGRAELGTVHRCGSLPRKACERQVELQKRANGRLAFNGLPHCWQTSPSRALARSAALAALRAAQRGAVSRRVADVPRRVAAVSSRSDTVSERVACCVSERVAAILAEAVSRLVAVLLIEVTLLSVFGVSRRVARTSERVATLLVAPAPALFAARLRLRSSVTRRFASIHSSMVFGCGGTWRNPGARRFLSYAICVYTPLG
jgi:hypothetical protein